MIYYSYQKVIYVAEEKLNELTNYAKKYINYFQPEDASIACHLEFYLKLSCKIERIFATNKLSSRNRLENSQYISYEDTLKNVKKFLDNINNSYFKLLTILIDNGTLKITHNSKQGINNVVMTEDLKQINVNFTNTLKDGRVLIHEFFHYLNLPDKYDELSVTRSFLTEFISILFESLYLDNCKDQDLYEYYNQKLYRYTNTHGLNIISQNILLILVCYQKYKRITVDNCMAVSNLLNLKLTSISIKNLENVLSIFQTENYEYIISNYFSYIIGFSLSCYIRKFKIIDKDYMKKIIEFNNSLKKSSNDSWLLLKLLGINSDCQSFLDDLFIAVQEEVQKH